MEMRRVHFSDTWLCEQTVQHTVPGPDLPLCPGHTILLLAFILYEITGKALPAVNKIEFSYPYSTTWNIN